LKNISPLKKKSLIFTDEDTISDFTDESGDFFNISGDETDDIKKSSIFTSTDKITPINTQNLSSPTKKRGLPPLPPPINKKRKVNFFDSNSESSWDNLNKTIKYIDPIFSSEEENTSFGEL